MSQIYNPTGEDVPCDIPTKNSQHEIEFPIDEHNYNMNNEKRGYAIILSHETFDAKYNLESRPTAVIDTKNASKCLDSLGFTTYSFENYTNRQILNLADEASRWDHEKCDCLVVVISTHGNDEGLLFSKNRPYYFERIVEEFAAIKSLAGKPKIFIVQACRGLKYDQGAFMETKADATGFTAKQTIPLLSDCLILYSSSEGYVSFKNDIIGSWLISSFFDVLQKNAYKKDILSIIRDTSRIVAFDLQSNTDNANSNLTKQMPTVHSFLTRKLQFQKKSNEPEKIISPQRVEKLSDQISTLYKMDHKSRGKAVIFNYENFDENMRILIKKKQQNPGLRLNVEDNIGNLNKTLKDYGFNVEIFQDLNSDTFLETLDKLSKYNYTDSDCLMIIINTYGYEKKLLLKDDFIEPYRIFNFFYGNNCRTLVGKPKLFFVNITNGNDAPGLSNDFISLVSGKSMKIENKIGNRMTYNENVESISINEELTKIPESADILIMYSSPLDITYDHNHSFFLKVLDIELSKNLNSKTKEILDILTEVNRNVSWYNSISYDENNGSSKIMPRFVSSLTRELYLK